MGVLSDIQSDLENTAWRLVNEHRGRLFAEATRLCGNMTEAEDLVMLSFDAAFRDFEHFESEKGDFYAWLRGILVHVYNRTNLRAVNRGTEPVEAEVLEKCAGADDRTTEEVIRNSDHDALREAIGQLDPDYRKTIALYYFNELSLKEIAALLGSSTSSVSRQLQVARRILAAKLSDKLGKKPVAVALILLLLGGSLFGAWKAGVGDWISSCLSASAEESEPAAQATERNEEMIKVTNVLKMAAIATSVSTAPLAVASGANHFVSTNGAWKVEGLAGGCYTTIKAALAAANPGDTVWVQDGFVCTNETAATYQSVKTRVHVDKAVTLRSESGFVDEANGKGAKIRGQYSSASAPCGWSSMRCVRLSAGSTLVGFVLEKGSTTDMNNSSYPGGGAIYGAGTVSNCVIRNNYGSIGGAVRADGTASLADCLHLEKCVITNNVALFYGAAVSGRAVLRECDISFNKTTSGDGTGGTVCGGSNSMRSLMYDCAVSNNTYQISNATAYGGGLRWVNAFDSTIRGNSVAGYGGGAAYCALSGCTVRSNTAKGSGSNGALGGGLCKCTATNCLIVLNKTSGGSKGMGGGGYNCDFYNCQVVSNKVNTLYSEFAKGGAGLYCTEKHECVNTLFFGHTVNMGTAAVSADGANVRLVNCTLVGNETGSATTRGSGGCYNAVLLNTIVYDNTGDQVGGGIVATNSCAKGLSTTQGPGNIAKNPLFVGSGETPYALSAKSPCRDKGFYDKDDPEWDWVSMAGDPRSRDLVGKPRLAGKGLDMGCYEFVLPGFLMLIR